MNHFLNSFGISNYIRQMMCGIIYFIPFFLFSRSSTECFLKNGQGDWSSTKLLVVAVVAACIGTLIYHVEKNLLGYSSQVFRAWCKHKHPKCPVVTAMIFMILAAILPLIVMAWGYKKGVVEVLIHWLMEWRISVLIAIFLAILPSFLLISALYTNLFQQQNSKKAERDWEKTEPAFDKTVEETRNAWKASSVRWFDMENPPRLHEIREISERESNWADFIHCGQTSAISWILGSITAVHLNQANVDSSLFWCGISIALWLLAFEFFCEWHKSLHIDYMVKQYQSFSENKK